MVTCAPVACLPFLTVRRQRTRVSRAYQPIKISSFGEGDDGDLYVVDIQGGTIYRVDDGQVPSA